MTTYEAYHLAKYLQGSKDASWLAQGLIKSNIQVMTDAFNCNPVIQNETIGIMTPPKGARVMFCLLSTTGLGAGVTVHIGDTNDATRYSAPINCESSTQFVGINTANSLYQIGTNEGDEQMQLQVLGADATGVVDIKVFYTV